MLKKSILSGVLGRTWNSECPQARRNMISLQKVPHRDRDRHLPLPSQDLLSTDSSREVLPGKNLPYWPYQGLETKQTSLSLLSSEGFKASWDRLALACVTECEGADTVSPWPSRWFAAFLIGVTKHTTKGNVRSDGFVLAHIGVSGVTDSCEQPNLGVENRTQGLNH